MQTRQPLQSHIP